MQWQLSEITISTPKIYEKSVKYIRYPVSSFFGKIFQSSTADFLKSVRSADFVQRDRSIVNIQRMKTEETLLMNPTVF